MEQPSEFTLCLPGDPVPKGRPRVYNGHAMTPKRTVRAEERLFAEFRLKYPQAENWIGMAHLAAPGCIMGGQEQCYESMECLNSRNWRVFVLN